MPYQLPSIEAEKEYDAAEVARMLPGRNGRPVQPASVRKMHDRGRLRGFTRAGVLLFKGADILRHLNADASGNN